jgi:hypothetical protein
MEARIIVFGKSRVNCKQIPLPTLLMMLDASNWTMNERMSQSGSENLNDQKFPRTETNSGSNKGKIG